MSCQRRAAVLIFTGIMLFTLYVQCRSPKPFVPPPPEPEQPKVVKVVTGTKTQGGTYNAHHCNDYGLLLEVKAPTGIVYEFYIWSGADIVLIDQKNQTRKEMTSSQMALWLDKNKSETLCTMVGVYKGRVDGLIVLIPGDPAPPQPPPVEEDQ